MKPRTVKIACLRNSFRSPNCASVRAPSKDSRTAVFPSAPAPSERADPHNNRSELREISAEILNLVRHSTTHSERISEVTCSYSRHHIVANRKRRRNYSLGIHTRAFRGVTENVYTAPANWVPSQRDQSGVTATAASLRRKRKWRCFTGEVLASP